MLYIVFQTLRHVYFTTYFSPMSDFLKQIQVLWLHIINHENLQFSLRKRTHISFIPVKQVSDLLSYYVIKFYIIFSLHVLNILHYNNYFILQIILCLRTYIEKHIWFWRYEMYCVNNFKFILYSLRIFHIFS